MVDMYIGASGLLQYRSSTRLSQRWGIAELDRDKGMGSEALQKRGSMR